MIPRCLPVYALWCVDAGETLFEADPAGHILIVEDRPESVAWFRTALEAKNKVSDVSNFDEALLLARGGEFDLIVVSLGIRAFDGLRLCSHLRSLAEIRNTPILVLVSDGENRKLAQALDMGVNDYLMRPIDRNELTARVKTQLRRKHYADKLRHNVQLSLEMAITDQLTGLNNRRYMARHLETLLKNASPTKPISFFIMDIDYFKSVNDTHGHDVGDEVLREFAARISSNVRGIDLACRYGGEEFVVVMPDTDKEFAHAVAERLRHTMELMPIPISRAPGKISITVSIGIASSTGADDDSDKLLHRADQALYRAKREGRNRVAEAA
jgi:two-component system cell cycle response regulator